MTGAPTSAHVNVVHVPHDEVANNLIITIQYDVLDRF